MINHRSKIETAFATSASKEMTKKRFGLRSCTERYDLDYIADIRELYYRTCELEPDCITLDSSCGHETIKELIQIL
jgi:hypothetical protein